MHAGASPLQTARRPSLGRLRPFPPLGRRPRARWLRALHWPRAPAPGRGAQQAVPRCEYWEAPAGGKVPGAGGAAPPARTCRVGAFRLPQSSRIKLPTHDRRGPVLGTPGGRAASHPTQVLRRRERLVEAAGPLQVRLQVRTWRLGTWHLLGTEQVFRSATKAPGGHLTKGSSEQSRSKPGLSVQVETHRVIYPLFLNALTSFSERFLQRGPQAEWRPQIYRQCSDMTWLFLFSFRPLW